MSAPAPAGSVVSIYYDGAFTPLQPGEALRTPTGRTYLVVDVRVQNRGLYIGRQHLRCVVTEGEAPAGVRVAPLHWYKRERRQRR